MFYEYINGKRRAKEKLHSLLDPGQNTVSKGEEKAEALNTLPGGVKERLGMTLSATVVLGHGMDSRISEVFSNLIDSVILRYSELLHLSSRGLADVHLHPGKMGSITSYGDLGR